MAELLETLQTKVELVKINCGDMCFHSGAHITAIPIFYEVPPGELFKIKTQTLSELGQISAIHSIPVFHAGNEDQMVLSMSFESGY